VSLARYHAAMTDLDDLRSDLIDVLRACRDAERAIFGALDPVARDAVGPDGGWSAKDSLAHLSAWRQRQATKMAAVRQGLPEPAWPSEDLDETNAIYHDERAGWSWDQVIADADATVDAFTSEIAAASAETLTDAKVLGFILGDGAEHDLAHLGAIAGGVGMSELVHDLADRTAAMVDRGDWPARAGALARYNLACFHALAGDLDKARDLLRQALPGHPDLLAHAPTDDDLIALRDEIPALGQAG
jgi:hypothetical protein